MPARRTTVPRWRRVANRLALIAGAGLLLWFAVEGGEYGTRALFVQHAERAQLERDVAQLKLEIDSLQKERQAVLKDDVVLERVAREQYGMLKGSKELLFWMEDAPARSDTARVTPNAAVSR